MSSRSMTLLVVGLVLGVALGIGCIEVKGPREPWVNVQGAIGTEPGPLPQARNVPPGPEHEACRLEIGRALAEIDRLRRENAALAKDLAEEKRDRDEDKDEHKAEIKQLKHKIDKLEDEIDRLEDKLDD